MDRFLEKHVPGYDQLNEDERQIIRDFSLLWTVFEGQFLDSMASATKIKEKTRELGEAGELKDQWFKDALDYFTDRYVDKNTDETNSKFASLNFRGNDDMDLVISALKKKTSINSDQLAACLIIVLRLRNNLFHGVKWDYEMREQKDNFEHSIELMKSCIIRFCA